MGFMRLVELMLISNPCNTASVVVTNLGTIVITKHWIVMSVMTVSVMPRTIRRSPVAVTIPVAVKITVTTFSHKKVDHKVKTGADGARRGVPVVSV